SSDLPACLLCELQLPKNSRQVALGIRRGGVHVVRRQWLQACPPPALLRLPGVHQPGEDTGIYRSGRQALNGHTRVSVQDTPVERGVMDEKPAHIPQRSKRYPPETATPFPVNHPAAAGVAALGGAQTIIGTIDVEPGRLGVQRD